MKIAESKDKIKDRLIRRAAEMWGVDEMEIEYSFDPIISLIFDACAYEFETIGNAIKTSRRRITERLVDLMTPEVSVLAKPAHAVMHAIPLDSSLEINENTYFYHRQRLPLFQRNRQGDFKDFHFAPAGKFRLNDCELAYTIFPNRIVSYQNGRSEELVGKEGFVNNAGVSSMYLGIKPGSGVNTIENLLCYFDLLNFDHKEVFLNHIRIAQWSLNDTPLQVEAGYALNTENYKIYSEYAEQNIQSKIQFYEQHIQSYYENHFYTITDPISVKEHQKTYPDVLENQLTDSAKDILKEELIWIKISFSSMASSDMIDNLHCHINCFPVINKRVHQKTRRLQPYFNIMPLETGTGAYFVDIETVEDSEGNSFYRSEENEEGPKAYLRFGGVSRFDERDASEVIDYLVDLLKEDSVAFHGIGDDFIDTNVREMKQIIARIEQRMEQREFTKGKIPYLIINNKTSIKTSANSLFTSYWTTDGASANKIKPFVRLQQVSGTAFRPDSLLLVTGSIGGTDEPTASEKIFMYRENIVSKGKIVTQQDIVNFAYTHYKHSIETVDVKKGVMVHPEEGIGYTPTTDIHITRSAASDYSEEDWKHLKKDFLITLRNRSANVLPFRVKYVS